MALFVALGLFHFWHRWSLWEKGLIVMRAKSSLGPRWLYRDRKGSSTTLYVYVPDLHSRLLSVSCPWIAAPWLAGPYIACGYSERSFVFYFIWNWTAWADVSEIVQQRMGGGVFSSAASFLYYPFFLLCAGTPASNKYSRRFAGAPASNRTINSAGEQEHPALVRSNGWTVYADLLTCLLTCSKNQRFPSPRLLKPS